MQILVERLVALVVISVVLLFRPFVVGADVSETVESTAVEIARPTDRQVDRSTGIEIARPTASPIDKSTAYVIPRERWCDLAIYLNPRQRMHPAKAKQYWRPCVEAYDWDVEEALNVLVCESHGRSNARNKHSGTIGLMQIHPDNLYKDTFPRSLANLPSVRAINRNWRAIEDRLREPRYNLEIAYETYKALGGVWGRFGGWACSPR